jgi:hypothetical protein
LQVFPLASFAQVSDVTKYLRTKYLRGPQL